MRLSLTIAFCSMAVFLVAQDIRHKREKKIMNISSIFYEKNSNLLRINAICIHLNCDNKYMKWK